ASDQLKTVLAQLEVGNGSGVGPGSQRQASPKTEQMARIDERQKVEDAREAGFDLAKARLNLLRALGHMDDWLKELRGKESLADSQQVILRREVADCNHLNYTAAANEKTSQMVRL